MRGDRQLTFRAVAMGMLLGGLLSVSNVYVGLRIGWSFGVSITATILAFAIGRAMAAVRPAGPRFTILENVIAQSCAGAAGYMAASGLNSAIPATMMLAARGTIAPPSIGFGQLVLWISTISVFGVLVATALRPRFIDQEKLRFPTGSACAEALTAMHAGDGALARVKPLAIAAGVAASLKLLVDGQLLARISPSLVVPMRIGLPLRVGGRALGDYTIGLPSSLLLVGAGALVGLRIALTLAAVALLDYAVIGPWLESQGVLLVFEPPSDPGAVKAAWSAFSEAAAQGGAIAVDASAGLGAALRTKWSVWPGTAALVSASVVSLLFRSRLLVRAARGLIGDRGAKVAEARSEDDPPRWVLVVGFVAAGAGCVVLQMAFFGVALFPAVLAVLAAVLIATVAARGTGETDIAPVGPLGKLTQLAFALIAPSNPGTNVMTANVTTGAAAHAAELLTDYKTGRLVGASPRKQLIAQLFGILAGSAVCVPAFMLLAASFELGGPELPAPAAVSWRSVAEVLAGGAVSLPRHALAACVIAGSLAAVVAAAEELAPRARAMLPSSTAIGIAMLISAEDSFAVLLGAVLARAVTAARPAWSARNVASSASGLIAGEALMGVTVALLRGTHVL